MKLKRFANQGIAELKGKSKSNIDNVKLLSSKLCCCHERPWRMAAAKHHLEAGEGERLHCCGNHLAVDCTSSNSREGLS
jgi:hypothetical protein